MPSLIDLFYDRITLDASLGTSTSESETQQTAPQPLGRHWIYQVWSRVLDTEVWFAHCQQELDQLIKKGIQRGIIYTESELAELIQLPYPTSQELKELHQAKTYFNATIIPPTKDDQK